MTVYARSDIAAVNISTDHGGCGVTHSRPAPGGIPAKIWALTCSEGCENVLRSDSHWAGTAHTIPETPDEVAIRNDAEKKNQVELHMSNAHALAELAKLGELPTAMAQALAAAFSPLLGAAATQQPAIAHLCRNGHPNVADTKFCGECGANMLDAANKQPVAALEEPALIEGEVVAAQGETGSGDLSGKSLAELQEIARGLGAKVTRSKSDQIDIIAKARAK